MAGSTGTVNGEALERFGKITREAFEARWIHSLLVGVRAADARFDHDRKGAHQLLRGRGWDLAEVSRYVEELQQGIRVIPRPPSESAAKPAKRRGLKAMVGLGGAPVDDWASTVNGWEFLHRRLPPLPPADSIQRADRLQEARDAIAGRRSTPRPKPESVMHGLRVEDLFSSMNQAIHSPANIDAVAQEPYAVPSDGEPLDPWED